MTDVSQPGAAVPAAAAPNSALEPGTKVGRYVILDRVGEGGMGVVFSAYDPELDRRVAIKLLASDLIGEESRLRLLREAQAMARLSHPNVVPVYDAGTVDGRVFVAMEFVRGVTLRGWLDAKTRPWTEVLDTVRRAGLGLQAAHLAGLVHRDFKPDNVMVGDDGRVRVLDFGLARSASVIGAPESTGPGESTADSGTSQKALAVPVTSDGAMLGTPAYMPPEQLEGRNVDARTDQWSFCVTLYEALYGTRPFDGDTVAAFVLSMHNDGVRAAPDSSPVPPSIFAAVKRGLELDPEARHPSIGALLDALQPPTPSRQRLMPLAVLGAGALAVASWWGSRRADDGCGQQGRRVFDIWSADAKDAGAEAFSRSALPYSDEAWRRASARIDAYVEAWSGEAQRACRAVGPGTAEVDTLRSRCLDARLRRLTTVVDAFAEANDEVVRGAVASAFQLPALEPCADVPSLLATVRPPDDPESLDELSRLEIALQDAAAFELSGEFEEGSQQTQSVVDQARRLAYDPFTAEALRTLASFAARRGDFEAARDHYTESFELAARVRDDAGAAQAAVDLIFVLGSKLQVPAAAQTWTTVGATMVDRAGLKGQASEASLHNAVGNVALSQGDYENALSEFSAARDIWEALPGDYPIEMGFVFSNLGVVQTIQGNYDEARTDHLRALKIREETLGPAHPDVSMSLSNVGALDFRTGDMAAARESLERALAIKRKALPPEHPSVASAAMNLGLVLARTGELEVAIELFEEAVELRTANFGPDHADVGVALGNLADAYMRAGGRDDEAETVHRRALGIQQETLGREHTSVAGTLQNLGALMLKTGRPEEATPLVEEALAIFTKAFGPNHPAVAMCWHTLSQAHEDNGRLDDAVEAAEKAMTTAEGGGGDEFSVATSRARLGMLRWRAGADPAKARSLVEAALAVMAETPDRETEEQARVQAWLQSHPLRD